VVSPDGTWYGACDPPALERIIQQHPIGRRPAQAFVLTEHPPGAHRD
jgi:(2Fe-2S) ferredoxin